MGLMESTKVVKACTRRTHLVHLSRPDLARGLASCERRLQGFPQPSRWPPPSRHHKARTPSCPRFHLWLDRQCRWSSLRVPRDAQMSRHTRALLRLNTCSSPRCCSALCCVNASGSVWCSHAASGSHHTDQVEATLSAGLANAFECTLNQPLWRQCNSPRHHLLPVLLLLLGFGAVASEPKPSHVANLHCAAGLRGRSALASGRGRRSCTCVSRSWVKVCHSPQSILRQNGRMADSQSPAR
jgi:hypothetical protein